MTRFTLQVYVRDRHHRYHLDEAECQQPLSIILADKGWPLNLRCGGRGLCQGCRVHLDAGTVEGLDDGAVISGPAAIAACRWRPQPGVDVHITVPERALLAHRPQVVDDFALRSSIGDDPITTRGSLGIAVDIGTTTVAACLVRLADGAVLARRGRFNRQMALADDVLGRIHHCSAHSDGVAAMQRLLVDETLAPLLADLLRRYDRADLGAVTVAGNATMLHLLAGVDPTPMGVVPFTPVFLDHRVLDTAGLALGLPAGVPVHLLPGAAAYIGADITAGLVASGLMAETEPSLLVDVGTNGEIVLQHEGRLSACAAAAGPAFEGAGLRAGTRAQAGAITHVALGPDWHHCECQRLEGGNGAPVGLCGTAYIDLLAEGRRHNLLTATGRFSDGWATTDADGARIWPVAAGVACSERDIAVLLQAKAAIAAGIDILLARAALAPADIGRVLVAGGFGLHLDLDHAIACGLLPGFSRGQVEAIGNSALGGAYMALLDASVLTDMGAYAAMLEIVELNHDPDFEMRYIEHLQLAP